MRRFVSHSIVALLALVLSVPETFAQEGRGRGRSDRGGRGDGPGQQAESRHQHSEPGGRRGAAQRAAPGQRGRSGLPDATPRFSQPQQEPNLGTVPNQFRGQGRSRGNDNRAFPQQPQGNVQPQRIPQSRSGNIDPRRGGFGSGNLNQTDRDSRSRNWIPGFGRPPQQNNDPQGGSLVMPQRQELTQQQRLEQLRDRITTRRPDYDGRFGNDRNREGGFGERDGRLGDQNGRFDGRDGRFGDWDGRFDGRNDRDGRFGDRDRRFDGRFGEGRGDWGDRNGDHHDDWDRNRGDHGDHDGHWNNDDWYRQHYGHHQRWRRGSWFDFGGGRWGSPWGGGNSLASLFGLNLWGINRQAYRFGYWDYWNPYYNPGGFGFAPVYDYSQPLIITEVQVSEPGMQAFEQARMAFYNGDYGSALANVDQALTYMPQDPALHEFRGLVLFAQGDYSEATGVVYSVLSVGPGWDWQTLQGLYPSVDIYTRQLRSLEAHVKANPQVADGRFLLGYHYLSCGHIDAARRQFQQVVRLEPKDRLSQELVNALNQDAGTAQPLAEVPNSALSTGGQAIPREALQGSWTAMPPQGGRISLTLREDGTFTWDRATERGNSQSLQGVYALDGNVLALDSDDGDAMLANIQMTGNGEFQFRMIGSQPNDTGLTFRR